MSSAAEEETALASSKSGKIIISQTVNGSKKISGSLAGPTNRSEKCCYVLLRPHPTRSRVPKEAPSGRVEELQKETGYICKKQDVVCLSHKPRLFEPAALTARYIPFLAINCTKRGGPKRDSEEIIRRILTAPIKQWMQRLSKVQDD